MKCLVFSDSHGNNSLISRALMKHPDAEVVFFLGDGLSDINDLASLDNERMWIAVKGNCDFSGIFMNRVADKTEEITLMGKKIVATHGDLYNAKYGTEGLVSLAHSRGADIVLFGHTHIRHEEYVDGEHPFYLFNPGSASSPSYSYGILTLDEKYILLSHGY